MLTLACFNSLIEGLLKQLFTKGVGKAWENKSFLPLYAKTLFGSYRNKRIRFSISYLYRIKVPETNSYLLVMNRRINNQLQPVGGCYKRYGDDKLFESWDYLPDNNINGLGTDKESEHDLRFTVAGKNVIKVIKWFEEGKEREIGATREFNEELIETGIFDREIFKNVKYKHLKRIAKYLKWSNFHNCHEILIYDILELLPDEKQRIFLSDLKQQPLNLEKGFALVKSDDIQQLRLMHCDKQIARIGEHSKYLINQ